MKKRIIRFLKTIVHSVLQEEVVPSQHVLIERSSDNLSFQLIQKYMPNVFFPYTSSSLNLYKINFIINDIIINNRRNIIEFGSGYSTIVLANFLKMHQQVVSFVSIEHDLTFFEFIKNEIDKLYLSDFVELIYCPLANLIIDNISCEWYDKDIIRKFVLDKNFDLIIIDGPPAYKRGQHLNRYPALPFIDEHLSPSFSVYLDDTNRGGEKIVSEKWGKKYGLNFFDVSPSLRHAYKGKFLNAHF